MPQTPIYHRVVQPWRYEPAEYLKVPGTNIKGWYQNGVRRKKVKPYYHLVWPKDKDRGTFGRLKDILQGKGPDIHLSISADKNDYMTNRPKKSNWSNWGYLDPRTMPGPAMYPGQYSYDAPFWVKADRGGSKRYNFFTRMYEDEHPNMWSDVIWQGPNKNTAWADQWRDVDGQWWADVNS